MKSQVAWTPSQSYIQETRIYQWLHKLGFEDYASFYEKSIEDIEWFWTEVLRELQLEWYTPYHQTLNLEQGPEWAKWFVGGQTNVYLNAVERWQREERVWQKPAILWENERSEKRQLTYAELAQAVDAAAYGLKALGLHKGDNVLLYLPMVPETVITMLACSKIGAIFTPIFSGFAIDGVQKRIEASQPKIIVTADSFWRKNKRIPMKAVVDEVLQNETGVRHVIVVSNDDSAEEDTSWTANPDRDVSWKWLVSQGVLKQTERMDSQDPFMLIYTSGTTSRPKGIVHTHTGFPFKAAFDAGICMDLKQEDTMLWVTDMGWMMGPFLVYGTLLNGSTMMLYDGSPDFPTSNRIWELVEENQITHLGISPTLIRAMMSKWSPDEQTEKALSSLRVFGSTGEPWNPEPWLWLFEKVGQKQVPIFNYSGGTEISGGIFGNILTLPIAATGFNTALPGMDARIYRADGEELEEPGTVGELVLKQPWVGMANGFWQEPERYVETYWSRWSNTWVHGDWVHRDEEGNWYITGRSDDTLNIAGKRMGPAEMESILVEHPLVKEAGTIGVPDAIKGETAVCFVVLHDGAVSSSGDEMLEQSVDSAELEKELRELIQRKLGRALSPKGIHIVKDLPKTRNAKIMRRVIRSAYLGLELGDISALEDPLTVEYIRACQGELNEQNK